jgi:pimeloyl-ACP methyl ester carboxylesterase
MMGLSLGAAASIGAAAEDSSIGVLVVDSSFADLSQMVDSSWTRESGLPMIFVTSTRWMIRLMYGWDLNDIKPVKEITQVPPRPVMIIACQDDQSVTVNQFEQLKAAVPSAQTWLLPHCIHGQTYNQDPALFEQKVIGFFEASLR